MPEGELAKVKVRKEIPFFSWKKEVRDSLAFFAIRL